MTGVDLKYTISKVAENINNKEKITQNNKIYTPETILRIIELNRKQETSAIRIMEDYEQLCKEKIIN